MKKEILFLLSIILLFSCNKQKGTITESDRLGKTIAETEKIELFYSIEINGVEQWILVNGNDISKPILLYLHGGPGHSQIPFAHYTTNALVNDFIVVHWDQRGAGLSLSESIHPGSMNINKFLEDTDKLTSYLLEKFNKQKIFLLGHSWGGIIGLYSIKKNPDLYHAYIGVGQVISPKDSAKIANQWLLAKAKENENDLNEIKRGMNDDFTNRDWLLKYGGILHNLSIDDFKDIRFSTPYYPDKYSDELYQRGLEFSAYRMHNEINEVNFFKEIKDVDIPVYFFCGLYDYVTPGELVANYCKSLKTPSKEIIWFNNSGHRPDVEEPVKFQKELIRIGLEVLK